MALLAERREGLWLILPYEIIEIYMLAIFKILIVVHVRNVYRRVRLLIEFLVHLHLLLRVVEALILTNHHLVIHEHRIHLLCSF